MKPAELNAAARIGTRALAEGVVLTVEASEVAIPESLDALEAGADISPARLSSLLESVAVDLDVVRERPRDVRRPGLADARSGSDPWAELHKIHTHCHQRQ